MSYCSIVEYLVIYFFLYRADAYQFMVVSTRMKDYLFHCLFNFKSCIYIYIYIKYVPESPTLKLYYILSIFFLQIVKIRNYEHKNFLNFLG